MTSPTVSSPTIDAGESSSSSNDAARLKTQVLHCPPFDPTPSPGSTEVLTGVLEGIKKHPVFWFDDGNLILIAKGRTTAFRIYAGLLASQSDVFANMFAIASSSADEVYDGCPVVPVYDSPEEFAHFLRVLMPKDSRNFHRTAEDAPLTFDHTAAVIRLANKYGLNVVRNQAVSVLQHDGFPSHGPRPWRTYPNRTLAVEDVHAIGAVNIARMLEKPALLYPALYRCTVLGSAVLDGWTRDDGEVERLAPADLKLCMDLQAALARESIAIFAATFGDAPCEDCKSSKECRAGLRKLEDAMLREEFGKRGDVLDSEDPAANRALEQRATVWGVCAGCRWMLVSRRDEKQREVWRRLPKLCGAEGWPSGTDEEEEEDDDEEEGDTDEDEDEDADEDTDEDADAN